MKLNNKTLENKIEEKINEINNAFSKNNKVNIELNFYQTVSNSFFSQKLTNLWESWKFQFLLAKKNSESNFMKNESENQKQKEHKIRKFIFEIIEKLNDKLDFMPDFDVDDKTSLRKETFPFEIKINNGERNSFLSLIQSIAMKNVLSED